MTDNDTTTYEDARLVGAFFFVIFVIIAMLIAIQNFRPPNYERADYVQVAVSDIEIAEDEVTYAVLSNGLVARVTDTPIPLAGEVVNVWCDNKPKGTVECVFNEGDLSGIVPEGRYGGELWKAILVGIAISAVLGFLIYRTASSKIRKKDRLYQLA